MFLKKYFLNDKYIIVLIFLNVALIFAGGFDLDRTISNVIDVADHFFTLLFVYEAIIKINVFSVKKYFRDSWNVFDFVLVIIALPSLFMFAFSLQGVTLHFLLVFRVLRVFKFLRFIRFIPNVDKVFKGFKRAAKSSILILIAFGVFNIIVAVFSTFIYKSCSPELFGNPLISLYNIFKVFTIEGWYEIPDTIIENSTFNQYQIFFTRLYFVVILFVGGIFGLSLVNSIFVDSMVSDNNDPVIDRLDNIEKKIDQMRKKSN